MPDLDASCQRAEAHTVRESKSTECGADGCKHTFGMFCIAVAGSARGL